MRLFLKSAAVLTLFVLLMCPVKLNSIIYNLDESCGVEEGFRNLFGLDRSLVTGDDKVFFGFAAKKFLEERGLCFGHINTSSHCALYSLDLVSLLSCLQGIFDNVSSGAGRRSVGAPSVGEPSVGAPSLSSLAPLRVPKKSSETLVLPLMPRTRSLPQGREGRAPMMPRSRSIPVEQFAGSACFGTMDRERFSSKATTPATTPGVVTSLSVDYLSMPTLVKNERSSGGLAS